MGITRRARSLTGERLAELHDHLRRTAPGVSRIAVALYDPGTGVLSSYLSSHDPAKRVGHLEARLAEVPSLKALADSRADRVVDDLRVFEASPAWHSQKLLEAGYRSSYAVPFQRAGDFAGFVFFDAETTGFFTPEIVGSLRFYAQFVALLTITELNSVRTLQAAVKTAREFTHLRDEETAGHLQRMAHFARLIAVALADSHALSDEYIELLFEFAPLHDIGKIAVPDAVLLKPGRLDAAERDVMETHVGKGVELVDRLVADFGMRTLPNIELMRNIVLGHHEAVDGSGYPAGMKGDAIPLESRIVTVADVFDALTSRRPYKPAWSNARAFAHLTEHAGRKFDADCVDVLERNAAEVEEIQRTFVNNENNGTDG
jgi:HD-GYP domain-containing protein (c-di-GMP phosphodiesterase class II)